MSWRVIPLCPTITSAPYLLVSNKKQKAYIERYCLPCLHMIYYMPNPIQIYGVMPAPLC
jgi:hypothetical protein